MVHHIPKTRVLLIAFSIGTLNLSCSASKTDLNEMRYFDENNVEISKSKFNRIRSTNKLLDVPGDSTNHRKLTLREERGQISDRDGLLVLLEQGTNSELPSKKPIVVVFHPGKDPCNANGTTDKEWIANWYGQLEEGLRQIAKVKPLYLYKDAGNLGQYDGIIDWHRDPEGIIEKLFFEHHYPCKSFVVISKAGQYISYFGEFSKEYLWEATQMMSK